MRRIRKPPVPQRVRNQKMTEFVVQIRNRNGMVSEQREAQRYRRNKEDRHRDSSAAREPTLPSVSRSMVPVQR